MKLIYVARAAFVAIALCPAFVAGAEVPVPALTGRVTDQTATLTVDQRAALEQTLQSFESRKGSQLAILIVPTTAPETIDQYSLRVAELWKLGRKKVDDGAVLVVAKNDRSIRIEVGFGLEGALNDATSKRIISEIITPRFAESDFYGGISAGVGQIIRVIDGESLPEPKVKRNIDGASIQQFVPVIFVLAIVLGGVLRSALGRFPGSIVTGGLVAVMAWFFVGTAFTAISAGLIALSFTLFGSGMRGLAGAGVGGHRGGFGAGGVGGGGFSGGGGGFGGGGASGRW